MRPGQTRDRLQRAALANLADGTLATACEYGPFGEVTAQAGLVYYNYRYYSPALDRVRTA